MVWYKIGLHPQYDYGVETSWRLQTPRQRCEYVTMSNLHLMYANVTGNTGRKPSRPCQDLKSSTVQLQASFCLASGLGLGLCDQYMYVPFVSCLFLSN